MVDYGEQTTGTRDEHYNLVSVLYHALSGADTCERYALDAETVGDERLAAFFRETPGDVERGTVSDAPIVPPEEDVPPHVASPPGGESPSREEPPPGEERPERRGGTTPPTPREEPPPGEERPGRRTPP